MKFNFKAKDREGIKKEGVIEAVDEVAALEVLQKNGLYPISIKAENTKSLKKSFLKYFDSVKTEELVIFYRQLAIMIGAKVPIISALYSIREETRNQYFSRIITEVANDIQDGVSLSDAFKKHPDVFSNLSISIIRAGEASGNLKDSIEYVANNVERNYELTSKVRSAMTYPAIVLIVFLFIGFLVISFVVPKLTLMIKELEVAVPWYTKAVITVSDFMAAYWWAVAIAVLGFAFGVFYYIRTEEGKREWDQIKIRLPIVGIIFKNVYITRFAENLSVLLAGGIPIIRALKIVSSVINNSVYENIFLKSAEEVKIGGEMSDVLRKYPQIPSVVSQMVKIGEESGQIDSVLTHVAKFYQQQTDTLTKNLSTLIEPILMIIIGIAVGVLAFAVLIPIYNITTSIS